MAFPFSPSRSGEALRKILKQYVGVLLSDGYAAYESHAARVNGIVHAQCWAHTRRQFLKAEGMEPKLKARALELIRRLYDEENTLGCRSTRIT